MFLTVRHVNDKKKDRSLFKGYYLILMRPKDQEVMGNNIRGLVWYATQEMVNNALIGHVRIGTDELTIKGNYGSDGYALLVDRKTWERGTPMPSALYDLYNLAGEKLPKGAEVEELTKWARALQQAQRGKSNNKCYRCGEKSTDQPCSQCEYQVKMQTLAKIRMETGK